MLEYQYTRHFRFQLVKQINEKETYKTNFPFSSVLQYFITVKYIDLLAFARFFKNVGMLDCKEKCIVTLSIALLILLLLPQAHPHLSGLLHRLRLLRLLPRGDRGAGARAGHHVLAQREVGLYRCAVCFVTLRPQEIVHQGDLRGP